MLSHRYRVCLLFITVPICVLIVIMPIKKTVAAACCGGSFAAPAMIVGDEKAQITTSYSYNLVTDDVGTNSIWQKRQSEEVTQTYKIDGAHVWKDRWQSGLSIPVVHKVRSTESTTGTGDISATLGYEYLTDWDYNPWRPRGFGFLQLILPSGLSIHESQKTYQTDVTGKGFWALGAGTVLTKTRGLYDGFLNLDIHKSFSKSYANAVSSGTVKPGWGGGFGAGLGYNRNAYRFGTSITWNYEDAIDVHGTSPSAGSPQRYATANLSVSYLWKNNWASTLSYSDQTIFGSPTNTSLSKGAIVFLQKRWPR